MRRRQILTVVTALACGASFLLADDSWKLSWPPPAEIDWRDDFRTTDRTTWSAWQEKLNDVPGEQRSRTRRMWRVALLETLLERFTEPDERVAAARVELAGGYSGIGREHEGRQLLWQLVQHDERPIAQEALRELLDDEAMLESAAAHIHRLSEAGELAEEDDRLVRMAVSQLSRHRLREGRLFEALRPWPGSATELDLHDQAELMEAVGDAAREMELQHRRLAATDLAEHHVRGARRRIEELQKRRDHASRPRVPGLPAQLAITWEDIETGDAGVPAFAALLAEAARHDGLVETDAWLHRSLWSAAESWLRSQATPAFRSAIAALDAPPARDATGPQPADADTALRQFRARPAAPQMQLRLLSLAEQQLRAGQSMLATRSFADVANHALEPALRERAERGLAHARSRGARSAEARRPPAEEPVPVAELNLPAIDWWPTQDIALIDNRLAHGLGPIGPALVVVDGHAVLASPGGLAVYDLANLDQPVWLRRPRMLPARTTDLVPDGLEDVLPVPASVQPAIAEGRIYLRWGRGRSGLGPGPVAAFDLARGTLLWSSEEQTAWQDLIPVSDPAVAEGRVYSLARHGEIVWNMVAVCQDADSGQVLWQRPLTSDIGPLIYDRIRLDLCQYNAAPLVQEGAVYYLTNMGVVARLDARDGLVEWLRHYPRAAGGQHQALAARHGAPPVAAGDAVVFMPRDRHGAFALNAANGELLWDQPLLPSWRVSAVTADRILAADRHAIAAVDARGGQVIWDRRMEVPLATAPTLAGGQILAATCDGALHHLDFDSGQALKAPRPAGETWAALAADGERAVALASASSSFPGVRVENIQALDADPATAVHLPQLAPRFDVVASGARVLAPPDGEPAGRVMMLSGNVLLCIDLGTSRPKVVWQRVLPRHWQAFNWSGRSTRYRGTHEENYSWDAAIWHGDQLIIHYPDQLLALNRHTGQICWRRSLRPHQAHGWTRQGKQLVMHGREYAHGHSAPSFVSVFDLDTGEILWQRNFRHVPWDNYHISTIATDARTLFIVGRGDTNQRRRFQIDVALADGRILRVLPADRLNPTGTERTAAEGRHFYGLSREGRLFTVDLASEDGPSWFDKPSSTEFGWDNTQIHPHGRFVQVRQANGYGPTNFRGWTYDRNNSAALAVHKTQTLLHGDRAFELDAMALHMVDLTTGQRQSFAIPLETESRFEPGRITDFWISGSRLISLAGLRTHDHDFLRPRLDAFDLRTGEHLEGHWLGHTEFFNVRNDHHEWWSRHSEAFWFGDRLVLGTLHGLRLFGGAAPAGAAVPAGQPPVHVARQDDRLRVQVVLDKSEPCAYLPAGWSEAGGDWLELAVKVDRQLARLGIGAAPDGNTVVRPLPVILNEGINYARRLRTLEQEGIRGHTVFDPSGIQAEVRHDPIRERLTYDIIIPCRRDARVAISLIAWSSDADQPRLPQRSLHLATALESAVLIPEQMHEVPPPRPE